MPPTVPGCTRTPNGYQQLDIRLGDRILFIFGAGHAYFFRELVSDHPNMTLVDPLAYP